MIDRKVAYDRGHIQSEAGENEEITYTVIGEIQAHHPKKFIFILKSC